MALPTSNMAEIEKAIAQLLTALGEDPKSERFAKTPHRVAKLYSDVMDGQFATLTNMTAFKEDKFNGAVMVHHVPFYAMCAHHLLLFQGTFGLAYVPGEKVLGLSKLVRIFRHNCKRPTTQEEITEKAVDLLMHVADAKGAMCYVRAEHTCMTLRGVKSPGSMTTTVAARGSFLEDAEARQMFLDEARR